MRKIFFKRLVLLTLEICILFSLFAYDAKVKAESPRLIAPQSRSAPSGGLFDAPSVYAAFSDESSGSAYEGEDSEEHQCFGAAPDKRDSKVHSEITVEAGTETVLPEDFLADKTFFISEPTRGQLDKPGLYAFNLSFGGQIYTVSLRVEDTVAPTATARNLSALFGNMPKPEDFVTDIKDMTEVTVAYKSKPKVTTVGDQKVTVLLTDTSGNTAEVTSVFTVLADKEPPVIKGVKPIKVYKGDSAAYRKGVSVSDNADARPKLAINSAGVNLSKPGKYKLIYTATDLAGNKSSVQTTVEVLPRKPAGNEVIYQKVDEVLAKIIVKGMTTRQKVVAIYNWAKFNCHYSVKPPSSDYMQAAYFMLTHHTGNCFYYYSVTKLMFDRLGIKNLHVNKVKNHPGDSYHHWSMVSVDGGKTWYHFDVTPRRGEGDDFCLVTDAFLDAYSKTHENCFNRDRSLYPATPAN